MAKAEEQKPEVQLSEEELKSRTEIPFRVDLVGIYKAYEKIFYDVPTDLFKKGARGLDGLSKRMMTGSTALIGMPLGIIARNTASVGHDVMDEHRYSIAPISGVVGAGAAWWMAGSALFGAFGASGIIGSIAVGAVAGALTAPVIIPAYTIAALTASTAAAAVTSVLSIFPAAVNLPTAWRRTKDRIKGVKYSQKELDEMRTKLDEESVTTKYERRALGGVQEAIRGLSDKNKQIVCDSLKKRFQIVASNDNAEDVPTVEKAAAAEATAGTTPKPPALK